MWPMIGAPDPNNGGQGTGGSGSSGASGAGGSQGGDSGGQSGQQGSGASGASGAGGASGGGSGAGGQAGQQQNAVDGQNRDLGYPKDTPVAEMNDKQQAAYWKHNARKHEGVWKGIVGDRSAEDVKKDLEAYAEVQRSQQTPAERALNDKFSEGKTAGLTEARRETATALFRGHLEGAGITGAELDETVAGLERRRLHHRTGRRHREARPASPRGSPARGASPARAPIGSATTAPASEAARDSPAEAPAAGPRRRAATARTRRPPALASDLHRFSPRDPERTPSP